MEQKGIKFDQGKIRFSLLPWNAVTEVVKVLEYGAKKYADNNWQLVEPKSRYIDAAFRHFIAWMQGEKLDKDTGLNHLAHCICCLLFLLWDDLRIK